jgi:pimeloyl-ACP methyl ester carboxylesterase
MLRKLFSQAAIGLAALSVSCGAGAAFAQPAPSPVGDWHGTLRAGERQTRSAIHLEQKAPGILGGDIDLPDTGQWDVPLEEVTFQDGLLAFSYRQGSRRFEGRWEPAAQAWVGKFQNAGGSFDVAYEAGFLGLPGLSGLEGFWEADASIQGYHRSFKLRVRTTAHGTYAMMDIPELVQTDLAVTSLARQEDRISFAVPSLGIRFEGALAPHGRSIVGEFDAGGAAIPVSFVRNDRGPPRRTQTPAAPYPYTTEEVAIANAASPGTTLACTLNVPRSAMAHPAAILITGSGQQDRDEALVGHRPFLVLADHLARHGIAVLRCDDRGVGGSRGDYVNATLEDFAGDATASLDYLRGRRDIASGKIGLIGHSEGAITASLAARRRPDLAFVVLLAGPGVPIDELLMMQGEEVARAQGLAEASIVQQRPLRRAILAAMRDAPDPATARKAVEALFIAQGAPPATAQAQAAREASPDILRIIKADPADSLSGLRAPVLAILGSKDRQVPPQQNLPALRRALGSHPDATIRELPGLNHLFQTAETGGTSEYYSVEETIAPVALKTITDWMRERGFGDQAR